MNCVATAAHDFVLEVPSEARLFVLLPPFPNAAGQTNIPATAYRDVGAMDRRDGHLSAYLGGVIKQSVPGAIFLLSLWERLGEGPDFVGIATGSVKVR